jgi:hypothetical protein
VMNIKREAANYHEIVAAPYIVKILI